MYERLKGEIARQKQMQNLTYEAIGEMIGYRANTVAMFMSGARESKALAEALAKGLNIEPEVLKENVD